MLVMQKQGVEAFPGKSVTCLQMPSRSDLSSVKTLAVCVCVCGWVCVCKAHGQNFFTVVSHSLLTIKVWGLGTVVEEEVFVEMALPRID